jgi:hypothetical protein
MILQLSMQKYYRNLDFSKPYLKFTNTQKRPFAPKKAHKKH